MHAKPTLKINMFHSRALNEYLNSRHKSKIGTCIKYVSSHIINYQYVSVDFSNIIRIALHEY